MLKSLWRDVRASLNRIFAIVVKEFAVTFGDKGSRMVLIAPVFLQAILFGYGATFNLERVPWVLLDESHSSASAEIVRGITGNGIFDLKRNAVSLADFEKSIDSSEALVGVYFPNDFDRKGEMMVVSDARNSTTAGIAYGYISSIATPSRCATARVGMRTGSPATRSCLASFPCSRSFRCCCLPVSRSRASARTARST